MSRKLVANEHVIKHDDGYTDGYSTLSEISNIKYLDNASYEVDWSSGVGGVISVLVSNSYDPQKGTGVFLPLVPTPTITQPNGSNTGTYIPLNQLGAEYIRLEMVWTEGYGGTVDAYFNAKSI